MIFCGDYQFNLFWLLENDFLCRGLVLVQSLGNVVVPLETWASRGVVPRDSLEILFFGVTTDW